MRHILALCCFAITALFPAAADTPDDAFCASSPLEMLSVLDGTWTFTQGPGAAFAGGMTIPLPPHPPQSMKITVDTSMGLATLKHDGQEMKILPVLSTEAVAPMEFLHESEREGLISPGAGCDWFSLPLMFGSNSYNLDPARAARAARTARAARAARDVGEGRNPDAGRDDSSSVVLVGIWDDGTMYYMCSNDRDYIRQYEPELPLPDSGIVVAGNERDPESEDSATPLLVNRACDLDDIDIPDPVPGQMIMNLLVKFQSPTSGTGMLIFQGEQRGYPFAAKAPVTFKR